MFFVGSNSTILPNVSIGPNTIIAAGSLVNRSIPGDGVYGGVPAKFICSFEEFIAKRERYPEITITQAKSGLSSETIDACWKRFIELNKDSK